MADQKIKFKRGSVADYTSLASKDNNTLYFITGGTSTTGIGELYLGNVLIAQNLTSGAYDATNKKLSLTDAESKTKIEINLGTGDSALQSLSEVQALIKDAITTAVRFQSSKKVAELNALTGGDLENGFMYNVTDSGTLTTGNVSVVTGDNVVWVVSGETGTWDKFASSFSLTDAIQGSGTNGQIAMFTGAHNISGYSIDDAIGSYVGSQIDTKLETFKGSIINTGALSTGATGTAPSEKTVADYVGSQLSGYIPKITNPTSDALPIIASNGTLSNTEYKLSSGDNVTTYITSGNKTLIPNCSEVYAAMQNAAVQWETIS